MSICLTGLSDDKTRPGFKPLAISVKDACKIIGIGNTTMWRLIGSGRVKTISIGRKRLVVFVSLEALIERGGETL